ncbi:hypothetical protein [Nocardioides aurantiacus]|uniref:Uncharacterized protein n=1 Tax=Nocardioides aurantiacus TaxID=86796 RepID=A0A3N2CW97_9ACTN|nr:hypothetical protein [Nocardioides aurantiacus]ROR91769.1 hypothetical protein EDD33_2644 [Nocardioides aurantiacus]
MSEAKSLAVVIAALRAQGSNAQSLADLNRMTTKPERYNQVVLTERPESTRRVGGSGGARAWRISILSVGRIYGDAQNEREVARRALKDQFLTFEDGSTAGVGVDSVEHDPIVPDEGWFSGSSSYVFDN